MSRIADYKTKRGLAQALMHRPVTPNVRRDQSNRPECLLTSLCIAIKPCKADCKRSLYKFYLRADG